MYEGSFKGVLQRLRLLQRSHAHGKANEAFGIWNAAMTCAPGPACVLHSSLLVLSLFFAQEGDVVDCTVRNIAAFGVFVELSGGANALLPISQVTRERIEDAAMLHDIFKTGDRIKVCGQNDTKTATSCMLLHPLNCMHACGSLSRLDTKVL